MGDMLLPIAPSKIQTKIKGNNKTITLINESEVNQIKGNKLTEISFDFLIPGVQNYPFAIYKNNKFESSSYFLDKLEKLKKMKKPFKFKIIRKYNKKGSKLHETKMSVTLESYTITESASDGLDLTVSVELKQYVDYGTKKLVVKKSKVKTTKTSSTKKARNTSKTYVVKKGDTLWDISKLKLGKSTRWKEIYRDNKNTIEKAARKHGRKSSSHGHWIYPGTKLKIQTS